MLIIDHHNWRQPIEVATFAENMHREKAHLLKMRDLSRATGVSSGTIRYYIQKGILPKPHKTHKNMAYYDASYVERIRLIKELQGKRFLPLDVIKMMLDEKEMSFSEEERRLFREIEKPLFCHQVEKDIGPLSMEEFVRHTGLPEADVRKLESLGMIDRDDRGMFDRDCVRIGELVARLRSVGLTDERDFHVEHLQLHTDIIEFLARKEVELFTKRIAGKGLRSDEISTLIKEAVSTLNSLIAILHERHIRKITERMQ